MISLNNIKKIISALILVQVMFLISGCSFFIGQNAVEEQNTNVISTELDYNESEEVELIEAVESTDMSEQLEEVEEEFSIEEYLIPFDIDNAFSYCKNLDCVISDDCSSVLFEMNFEDGIPESDDDNIYLFELSTYENEEIISETKPVGSSEKNLDVVVEVPYKDRYLFSRFVPTILYNEEYIPLSNGLYLSNPERLANNTSDYPIVESKKGILLDANTIDKDELYDLNVKRAVYNIPLSLIIGDSDNTVIPTIDYEYNGEVYHFNGYFCAGYDSLFSYLQSQGIHSTAIILNDWNKNNPEIIHPLSRKKTGKSLYYAFNTEEEDGVRLMEATAMFLADRYSSGEYGMVYDWVIANEINQQTIWNYMSTSDLDYYTESFERTFRTFYNAIRANYSNAKVYFSIDHDWNDNYGNNSRFFNGRDILYKFNELASRNGNYDWNLSIHPYPQPLPRVRFWKGEFDKTEEAGVVTPMNLSSLTDVMTKKEFLNKEGDVRDIAVTELGFSSKSSEKLQAAAFAYCYYIIDNNEYINSFLLNRQTDDTEALKSGLALGIYNNDYSPKYIKEVFANVDSEKGKKYIPEMLEIIGAESFEEAMSWAK